MNDKERWRKERNITQTYYGYTVLRSEQVVRVTNYDEPRQETVAGRFVSEAHSWYQAGLTWLNDRCKGDIK